MARNLPTLPSGFGSRPAKALPGDDFPTRSGLATAGADPNRQAISGKKPGSHLTDLQHPWRRIRARADLARDTVKTSAARIGDSIDGDPEAAGDYSPDRRAAVTLPLASDFHARFARLDDFNRSAGRFHLVMH